MLDDATKIVINLNPVIVESRKVYESRPRRSRINRVRRGEIRTCVYFCHILHAARQGSIVCVDKMKEFTRSGQDSVRHCSLDLYRVDRGKRWTLAIHAHASIGHPAIERLNDAAYEVARKRLLINEYSQLSSTVEICPLAHGSTSIWIYGVKLVSRAHQYQLRECKRRSDCIGSEGHENPIG